MLVHSSHNDNRAMKGRWQSCESADLFARKWRIPDGVMESTPTDDDTDAIGK
jgi:hypothetical protein